MNYYPAYNEVPQAGYHQLGSEDYVLKVRQQPRDGLLAQDGKEKNRKPIDPPPFIELTVKDGADPRQGFLVDPYLFLCASLLPVDVTVDDPNLSIDKALCGSLVSSLHKLKDVDSRDGGFFVFGDLSVKRTGEYKLLFSLFELQPAANQVVFLRSIMSDVFTVHPQKEYPGLEESTVLSRTFQEQGVKLRLRKEARPAGSATSGRKRSYPFGANQSVKSSASRQRGGQSSTQQTPLIYDSSPAVGESPFADFRDLTARHVKPEDSGQYGTGYASTTSRAQNSSSAHDSIPSGFSGAQGLYQHTTTHSPGTPQSRLGSQHRWPQPYYSQGAGVSGQSMPSPQHPLPSTLSGISAYDRPGSMGYGTQQHGTGGGIPQGLAIQVQGTPPTSGSPFVPQQHHPPFGQLPDSSSAYATYHDHSQYRSDPSAFHTASQGHTLQPMQQRPMTHDPGMYSDQSLQQPYGDMSYNPGPYDPQGRSNQSSYDAQGRQSDYDPPSRSWSAGQQ